VSETAKQAVILAAGKLEMIYDSGNIRRVSLGQVEIIRMVYAAVRDEYWETIEPKISNEIINSRTDSFDITYSCRYKRDEIDFEAEYQIIGLPDGSLSFEMSGEAKSDFKKNRIGFCVLHPVNEYAGKPVIIAHPDGSSTKSEFPVFISPYQPFKNISSMKSYFSPTEYSLLEFTGEIFETEDQRNWTDGSYKTYCTPLENPKPTWIKKGEKIKQKVLLTTAGDLISIETENREHESVRITVESEKKIKFPEIGICKSVRRESLTVEEIKILKVIPFQGYRVEIYFFRESWKETLKSGAGESKVLGYPIECALFLKNGVFENLTEFIDILTEIDCLPTVLYLFGEECHCLMSNYIAEVVKILRKSLPGVKIGCGTNANFAQLNREKPTNTNCDFISFAIHPQEHAFDNDSLIENAEAQKYALKSTLAFSDGFPVSVSPVTLKRRFNANKEFFENDLVANEPYIHADHRQFSIFAACWTLSSLKYLAEAGVKSITYYETVGERGIIQGNFRSTYREKIFPDPGTIFPVYILFKFLLNLPQTEIIPTQSNRPLEVDVLGIRSDENRYFLIWNFKDSRRTITISDLGSRVDYFVINANLYLMKMSQSDWLENNTYTEVSNPNEFVLTPHSIAVLRSF
jgi:hypothetical protein